MNYKNKDVVDKLVREHSSALVRFLTRRMKSREDVVVGLENFPEALTKLFTGENFGKLVLEVAKD